MELAQYPRLRSASLSDFNLPSRVRVEQKSKLSATFKIRLSTAFDDDTTIVSPCFQRLLKWMHQFPNKVSPSLLLLLRTNEEFHYHSQEGVRLGLGRSLDGAIVETVPIRRAKGAIHLFGQVPMVPIIVCQDHHLSLSRTMRACRAFFASDRFDHITGLTNN